jgi:signal transduction histidine kinase
MLAIGMAYAADDTPRKRVLILESFGQPLATAGAVALRTTLERELGEPVDVYHVSLDVARFSKPDHEVQFRDFLKSRYEERKLDLVAPLGAPAARFVVRQREHLFATTPVVISGIEHRRVPENLPSATTTYVAGSVDLPGHIENIVRLLPDTRRIVMIHGASSYDQFWAKANRRELQPFSGRIEIEWLEGRSFEQVRQQVTGLAKGSVVFLGLIVSDAAGIQIGRQEALQRLREVAKVPIFAYFESYMGEGIVGGKLYPDVESGVEAARAAIRILRGEAPRDVRPRVIAETRPIYDWRELQRFGIDESRLPPGSEVRYRQQTLWEAYRWHIVAIFGLVILQSALITGLVLQRARQRRAQADRKRAEGELSTTRTELAHMTRVFTLGELSSSLAHELNQPLAAILSNAQAAQRFMASENPADRDEVREILADIVQADKHAGDVIRRMRSMVKKDRLQSAPLDMATAAKEVLLLLHNDAVLRNVEVSLDAEPGLPAVLGDRIQLQQVVLNLLLNAFEAMKDTQESERSVRLRVGRDEHMLKVTVTDVGHGLSDGAAERVFDAFYTTKPNGLGMGLSISRSIIEAHRGRLWAENNRARGATFCFTIPPVSG